MTTMNKTCETCQNDDLMKIPYAVFEAQMAREERTKKRLTHALVALAVAFVIQLAGWLWFLYSYDSADCDVISESGSSCLVYGDGDTYICDNRQPEVHRNEADERSGFVEESMDTSHQ